MAKRSTYPAAGEGPLFWKWLVLYPGVIAGVGGYLSGVISGLPQKDRDPLVFAHAFVVACFSMTSIQCLFVDWYARNVEGDLGHPGFVHVMAGALEFVVVALRVVAFRVDDARCLAAATVLTGGLMGGAAWTWLVALRKPLHFFPAALVLACTYLTRPGDEFPTLTFALLAAFTAGVFSAALILLLFAPKKKKVKKVLKKKEAKAD